MPVYPGAALFTNIVATAAKSGRHPDDVYKDYLRRPEGYRYVWAYEAWVAECEAAAAKQPSDSSLALTFRRS